MYFGSPITNECGILDICYSILEESTCNPATSLEDLEDRVAVYMCFIFMNLNIIKLLPVGTVDAYSYIIAIGLHVFRLDVVIYMFGEHDQVARH